MLKKYDEFTEPYDQTKGKGAFKMALPPCQIESIIAE
jgi:hypothetical protein